MGRFRAGGIMSEEINYIKIPPNNSDRVGRRINVEELESVEKKLRALEIIKKHFIIKMSEETELNGNVWGRLVRIQSREDEGTWDTTAMANIVDYKEDFDLLKEVLDND